MAVPRYDDPYVGQVARHDTDSLAGLADVDTQRGVRAHSSHTVTSA